MLISVPHLIWKQIMAMLRSLPKAVPLRQILACSEEAQVLEFDLEQVSGCQFLLLTWLAHHQRILHTYFPILNHVPQSASKNSDTSAGSTSHMLRHRLETVLWFVCSHHNEKNNILLSCIMLDSCI